MGTPLARPGCCDASMPRPEPADPIAWLFGLQRFGVRPGLERTRALLARSGNPGRRLRKVLVGGTNGKGSTARVLAACLAEQGILTGLYTSPHLVHPSERVLVGEQPVSDAELAAAVAALRPAADALGATFFEVFTVAALQLFEGHAVHTAVLEVGLGGRWDATNAVDPSLSVVTGVALDHTEVLGDTLALVAAEKAGILRPGVPALSAAEGEARRALSAAAPAVPIAWVDAPAATLEGWEGSRFVLRTADGPLALRTPLVGRHQVRNAALAAASALHLGVGREAVARGVARARWPGRIERLAWRGRSVVLDGAHNPEAAAALVGALAEVPARVDLALVGVSQGKDVEGIGNALRRLGAPLLATRAAHSPRAWPPEDLAASLGTSAWAEDPAAALAQALARVPAGGTVLVAGSLFLVGEVRALILELPLPRHPRWQ